MIAYCVISPVINGFGAAFFVLSALVYKYLFIWVYDQPSEADTGGLFFPKAVTHVFVGIYIQEVCLCALFFLARNADDKVSAIPQGALMVVLILLTVSDDAPIDADLRQAGAHYTIVVSYAPLIHSLPLSLAHLSYGMPREKGHSGEIIGHDDDGAPPVDSSQEHLTGEPKPPMSATTSNSSSTPVHRRVPIRAEGIPTSAGPPVQESPDVELGQLGHPSDPEGDANQNEPYFAVPGGPGIQQDKEVDGNDPNAFFHPATKEAQRILWLPHDELGLCQAEIEANASAGVQSTCRYAILNSKVSLSLCFCFG